MKLQIIIQYLRAETNEGSISIPTLAKSLFKEITTLERFVISSVLCAMEFRTMWLEDLSKDYIFTSVAQELLNWSYD